MRPLHSIGLLALLLFISLQAHAQQQRPKTDNYTMPTDVQAVGGGEKAKSTNYTLDDTVGEPNIGDGESANYQLDAGYRQTGVDFLSLSCGTSVAMGSIAGNGLAAGSGSCVVITDADAGYSLSWTVSTGSGGTATGYLIDTQEHVIAPYTPAVAGTPETWSVGSTDARWGGRLSSDSTDDDAKWGTDAVSEKWLNVGTGSYTVVQRTSRTDIAGSTQILEFRVEIGSTAIIENGTYETDITVTATSL